MARQRFIKPSFFRHAELFEAERQSGLPLRLAFAGLWTVADRRGVFRVKASELKLEVLPYDQVDFEAVLQALESAGFIARYQVAGKVYGVIPTFEEHQSFHRDEAPSKDPGPDHPGASPVVSTVPTPPKPGAGTVGAQGKHGATTVPDQLVDAQAFDARARGQHGASTVPAPQEHGASTPITTTITTTSTTTVAAAAAASGPTEAAAAAEPPITDPHQLDAYRGFVRSARNPNAVRRVIAAVAEGMPGHGDGYGWQTVGQALLELAAAGSSFSQPGLLAFARKVRDRPRDGPKVEMVTDENGVEQPATRNPDGSWHYLTADERQLLAK